MATTKKSTEPELTDTEKEADAQAAASREEIAAEETDNTAPEQGGESEANDELVVGEGTGENGAEESEPEPEPSLNDEFNRLAAKIMLTLQDTPVRETILNKLTQLQMLTQAVQPI